MGDLMALSIFFAAFLICSLLVFFLSVYGAKEVTFEENLKATGQTGKSKKKSSKGQDTKKKNAKKLALAKGPDTSEIKPVVQEPKRPETPIEEPEEEEIEAEVEPEPEVVEPEVVEPDVVEEIKQQSSAEATPKKSKKKKNKINIEEVDDAVEE